MGSLDRFCGTRQHSLLCDVSRFESFATQSCALMRSPPACRRSVGKSSGCVRCEERFSLDLFGDVGTKKESLADVPALLFLHNGVADVLLVVRSADREAGRPRDALDALLLTEESPIAWATVPMLRRTGLLPPAIGLPTFARQRAAELRARGLTLDVIARWLDTEGYAAPGADPRPDGWTRGDVARLLREKPPQLDSRDQPTFML